MRERQEQIEREWVLEKERKKEERIKKMKFSFDILSLASYAQVEEKVVVDSKQEGDVLAEKSSNVILSFTPSPRPYRLYT